MGTPQPVGDVDVLSPAEALTYWDQRHRAKGPLQSGGDVGIDHASNEMFYAVRLARIIDVIGDAADERAAARILDAGCGKGYFSRALASFGHRVDGIDASPHAIEVCRASAGPRDRYEVSLLADWQPPYVYDVVLSIDVLFHLMDDEQWATTVSHLTTLVRWGGRLVLADHEDDEDRYWGTYMRTRAVERYRSVVDARGFRYDGFTPYGFRHHAVGLHAWTRVA